MFSRVVLTMFLFLSVSVETVSQNQNKSMLETDSSFQTCLIAIVVSDIQKTATWYKEKLGFSIIKQMEFPQYDSLRITVMKLHQLELELIQKSSVFSIHKYVPDYDGFNNTLLIGFAKIAFIVKDAETLESELKSKNVYFLTKLRTNNDMGIKSFMIQDPDGNILQFRQTI